MITPSTDGQGASNFTYHGPSSLMMGKRGPDEVPNEPYFFIDEASATIAEAMSIPLDDIALIRFAPPPVWFAPGNGGPTGALLIYTKKFGDEKKRNRSAFDQYSFNGYTVTREFPSTDYSFSTQNRNADYRTTLYWNHDLNTDERGNIKIHFNNSDNAKKYRVVVQAMATDGKIGYLNVVF